MAREKTRTTWLDQFTQVAVWRADLERIVEVLQNAANEWHKADVAKERARHEANMVVDKSLHEARQVRQAAVSKERHKPEEFKPAEFVERPVPTVSISTENQEFDDLDDARATLGPTAEELSFDVRARSGTHYASVSFVAKDLVTVSVGGAGGAEISRAISDILEKRGATRGTSASRLLRTMAWLGVCGIALYASRIVGRESDAFAVLTIAAWVAILFSTLEQFSPFRAPRGVHLVREEEKPGFWRANKEKFGAGVVGSLLTAAALGIASVVWNGVSGGGRPAGGPDAADATDAGGARDAGAAD